MVSWTNPAFSDTGTSNIATLASVTTSYVSPWETLSAVNDNSTPSNSNDKSDGAYGNWNHPNSIQWVQYDWSQNYSLSSTEIYWFDDNGGVLVPTTAYIEYWDGDRWINIGDVPVEKDAFNTLELNDIKTRRLRVSMLNSKQSTGILEWRIYGTLADDNSDVDDASEIDDDANEDYTSDADDDTDEDYTLDGDCAGPTSGTTGSNPLIPDIYTADPAVLVHDCTFYITAGHDEGTNGFYLNDWYVLSSTDMVNWTDNGGPVLTLDVFSWADANAWASQMVERNGKFYWYVPVNKIGGGMAIGVAVADSPLGPFQDAIGAPLIDDEVEMQAFNYSEASQTVYTIDPTVFIDDDGQAYLAYGGFWRMVSVALSDDMISLKGSMVEQTPDGFFEAPYLTKHDGGYYMVYAAGSNPATIDYATSDSPMGPWQYRGRILDSLPNLEGQDAATSHPAIAEFAGQWYLVYHLSDGPYAGTYRRQVAIEKLNFNADGTIEHITPSSGLSF
ncbi:MAG: family 43 glycosylhydrolase [Desulfobacteraceae bacterium]